MNNTDTNTKTYVVAQENLGKLTKQLDKLARRAEKLDLAPISYVLGNVIDRPYLMDNHGRPVRPLNDQELAEVKAKKPESVSYFRFQEITVTGSAPRLAGWTFVGTLQHLTDDKGETINVLRTVPGFEGQLPERFRTASPENCDHCKKAIKTRKDTFVVRHESGEWKQVGRNCTQDFLGGVDPQKAASYLDLVLQAFDEAAFSSGDGFGGGHGTYRFDTLTFLSVVGNLIRREGWVSRSKARDYYTLKATADLAMEYLVPPRDGGAYEKWSAWVAANPVEAGDRELAEKALDYARYELANKPGLSDYEYNLYVATTQATVDERLAGIVASLVPYYLREVERQVADSQFVGAEGEKVTCTVQVVKVIPCESRFGTSFLHKLVDSKGNSLAWFSSNAKNNLRPGETYTVKATVRKHEVYKGVKQTTLSRLTVVGA